MSRGIKANFTKIGIICLAVLLALGALGITYATWSDKLYIDTLVIITGDYNDPFSWVVSNDDGSPDEISPYGIIDPGDDGGGAEYDYWDGLSSDDPSANQTVGIPCARYDKDVARTTAWLEPDPLYPSGLYSRYITVALENAYPSYYPTIFYGLKNAGTIPAKIVSIEVDENFTGDTDEVLDDIPQLTVAVSDIYVGQVIDVGDEVIGNLEIHVERSADQNTTYTIRVKIVTTVWSLGGTPGYWQNWPAHWTSDNLTDWLQAIDAEFEPDDWLVPDKYPDGVIDYHDWDAIRDAGTGSGATPEERFLMHYTATRLNVEADRLSTDIALDISEYDPTNWLGVSNINDATLGEVIAKIEDKWVDHYDGTPLSKQQFNIMKNICVAFNELGPS